MNAVAREKLPSVTLSGDPFDRGRRHGESFEAEVAANVDRYLELFEHYGASRDEVLAEAERYLEVIEDCNESYAEELRGVADGSGLSPTRIALLNARYEVIYGAYRDETDRAERSDGTVDGCTSVGVRPEATADGRTYLGQNWDWLADVADGTVVTRIRREDGPNHVAVTEAGIVGGKMGVNEAGIGLVINGLVSATDGDAPYRKPFHVRCREILEATRLDRAVGSVIDRPRTCSANFLLGHRDGEIIDVEAAPESAAYIYPDDHVLTHANHFERCDGVESRLERLIPDSLCRGPRLRRLLETGRGSIDEESLQSALRDHFDEPASICRHVDPDDPPEEREQTNVSVVLDLEDRSLCATAGPPCERSYHRYRCPSSTPD